MHAASEGTPRRDGDLDVKVGIEVLGGVQAKATIRVSPPQQDTVAAFIAEAVRRRGAFRG